MMSNHRVIDALARRLNELDEEISQMQEDFDKAEALNSQDSVVQGYLGVISGLIHMKQVERTNVYQDYVSLVNAEFD
jgi:hypothetical protein